MRNRVLGAITAAALLVTPAVATAADEPDKLLAPESACPGQSDRSLPHSVQTATMVCMHQYARAQAGLQQFHGSKKLRTSSSRKARDVMRCKQFSHTACGRDAFYWFRRVGFMKGNFGVGENLVLGSGDGGTVRSAMNGWLHSDPHRSILLTASFDRLGIGLVTGEFHGFKGTAVWVAHFGYQH
jgi:uncharacterized protein YkwD